MGSERTLGPGVLCQSAHERSRVSQNINLLRCIRLAHLTSILCCYFLLQHQQNTSQMLQGTTISTQKQCAYRQVSIVPGSSNRLYSFLQMRNKGHHNTAIQWSEADNSLEWCKMSGVKSLMALGSLCGIWSSGKHWLQMLLSSLLNDKTCAPPFWRNWLSF